VALNSSISLEAEHIYGAAASIVGDAFQRTTVWKATALRKEYDMRIEIKTPGIHHIALRSSDFLRSKRFTQKPSDSL
jgi:hypothetical protein